MTGWTVALLATASAHLGFQLTVTVLVYPALARVPAEAWSTAHDLHSRWITPVVALVYGALVVTVAGAVLTAPTWGVWVALAGTLTTFLATATVAAPTHGRLGAGRTPELIARLLAADRVRLAGAVLAFAGAVAAATLP